MPSPYAKLQIPLGLPDEKNHLNWRIGLIQRTEVVSLKSLHQLINGMIQTASNSLDEPSLRAWEKIAKSLVLQIDDFDHALLTGIAAIARLKPGDPSALPFSKTFNDFFAHNTEKVKPARPTAKQIRTAHDKLVRVSDFLVKNEVPRIRAKFAVLELMAGIIPDTVIPQLLRVSLKYLACPAVHNWIAKRQYLSLFGTKEERKRAALCFNRLLNALKGDRRKLFKKQYSYWLTVSMYDKFAKDIKKFRSLGPKKKNNYEAVIQFCKSHNLDQDYVALILGKKPAAKQLALELVIEMGLVKSEKAFYEFQPFINRLKTNHSYYDLLPMLFYPHDEINRKLADFAPPQHLSASHLWDVVEQVD